MDAPIVVRAEVELFSREVSGKTTGYASGARPNHYIAELGSMAIGELQFEGRASLDPGERATATIVFLPWAPLLPLLQPGFEWRLQEGRRVVGKAQLVEVLSGA